MQVSRRWATWIGLTKVQVLRLALSWCSVRIHSIMNWAKSTLKKATEPSILRMKSLSCRIQWSTSPGWLTSLGWFTMKNISRSKKTCSMSHSRQNSWTFQILSSRLRTQKTRAISRLVQSKCRSLTLMTKSMLWRMPNSTATISNNWMIRWEIWSHQAQHWSRSQRTRFPRPERKMETRAVQIPLHLM